MVWNLLRKFGMAKSLVLITVFAVLSSNILYLIISEFMGGPGP